MRHQSNEKNQSFYILTLVKIPLNERYETYAVYKIFNIPVIQQRITADHKLRTITAAKYNL